jgi:hypothetical protein
MVLFTVKYPDCEYTTVKPFTTFDHASAFCESIIGYVPAALEPDTLKHTLVGPDYYKWSKNNPPELWQVGSRTVRMYMTKA